MATSPSSTCRSDASGTSLDPLAQISRRRVGQCLDRATTWSTCTTAKIPWWAFRTDSVSSHIIRLSLRTAWQSKLSPGSESCAGPGSQNAARGMVSNGKGNEELCRRGEYSFEADAGLARQPRLGVFSAELIKRATTTHLHIRPRHGCNGSVETAIESTLT